MLYLSRKPGEAVIINNSIEIVVMDVKGKNVKLGFKFGEEDTVLRKEIHDNISAENVAALHHNGIDMLDFLHRATKHQSDS